MVTLYYRALYPISRRGTSLINKSLYYIGFGKGKLSPFFKKIKIIISVAVHRIDVLGQCLFIVAGFTKTLPIGPVPEQLLVSTMGCDVVNHSGFRVSTLFHAHSAQRVALKELLGLRCHLLP